MARIWNIRDRNCPKNALYIGRAMPGRNASKYQNPFKIGVHGSREQVLEDYCIHAKIELLRDPHWLDEFKRAMDACCWCAPLPCHGDILNELAKEKQ